VFISTCIGGGLKLSPKQRVEPVEGSKMNKLPPIFDRAKLRSKTLEGFARAVYKVNAKKC